MCVACLVSFFTQRRGGAEKNNSRGDVATQREKIRVFAPLREIQTSPLLKNHHPLVGHDQWF